MGQDWYYNFMNLNEAVQKEILGGKLPWLQFRYVKDIINTKVGMFEYDDLPDDLTSQIVEMALLYKNHLCLYKVPALGRIILGCYVPASNYNYYWKPNRVNFLALNGETLAVDIDYNDIILVRDNKMDIMPYLVIQEYLEKISSIEDKLFKVMTMATLPLVLAGNKKQATAMKITAKNLGYKDPFIVTDESVVDSVKSFDINLRTSPVDIYVIKRKYMNECLSSLGIYSPEEKGERLLVDEIAAQNDYTDFIYTEAVNERKLFIEECNKRYGTNIKLRETYMTNFMQTVEETKKLANAEAVKKPGGDSDVSKG